MLYTSYGYLAVGSAVGSARQNEVGEDQRVRKYEVTKMCRTRSDSKRLQYNHEDDIYDAICICYSRPSGWRHLPPRSLRYRPMGIPAHVHTSTTILRDRPPPPPQFGFDFRLVLVWFGLVWCGQGAREWRSSFTAVHVFDGINGICCVWTVVEKSVWYQIPQAGTAAVSYATYIYFVPQVQDFLSFGGKCYVVQNRATTAVQCNQPWCVYVHRKRAVLKGAMQEILGCAPPVGSSTIVVYR